MHGLSDVLGVALLLMGATAALGAFYALWVLYIATMALKRAHDGGTLRPVALVLGLPVLVVGLALDALVNLTLASIVFLDPPREVLLTARLKRLLSGGHGWRRALAAWVCSQLLDTFDPGGFHCR